MWAELGLLLIAIQGKGTSFEWFLDKANHPCYCNGVIGCPEGICEDGCKHGWNGPLCQIRVNGLHWFLPPDDYPCHCANKGTDCPQNGCLSACEDGWYGFLCQIGNVAKNKPANQSSDYQSLFASKAVDGIVPGPVLHKNDNDIASCSHTASQKADNAWWYVDLGDLHVILDVVVIGRRNDSWRRLGNFAVLVGNGSTTPSSLDNWMQCAYKSGVQENQTEVYTCSTSLIGKKLGIRLNQTTSVNILTLCEVYVNGYILKQIRTATPSDMEISQSCTEIQINFTSVGTQATMLSPVAFVIAGQEKSVRSLIVHKVAGSPKKSLVTLAHQLRAMHNVTVAALWCSSQACSIGPALKLNYTIYIAAEREMMLPTDGYPCHYACTHRCTATTILGECALDWHGPLCQMGNVACGKDSRQSTDYSIDNLASNAVDGLVAADDSRQEGWGVKHCTHTALYQNTTEKAWWYVDLGGCHTIFAVRIKKRTGDNRLTNFSIRVTNTTDGSPPSQQWSVCHSHPGTQDDVDYIYSCFLPIIGRRVGILLNDTRENILILCEVYVYNYAIKAMPTLDNQRINTFGKCDTLTLSISKWLPTMYIREPSDYYIYVKNSTTKYVQTIREKVSTKGETSVAIRTFPGHLYNFDIAAAICREDHCLLGPLFSHGMINTGFRQAASKIIYNCTQVWVTATSQECYIPSQYNVSCTSTLTGHVLKGNGTFCDLASNSTFACNVSWSFKNDTETLPVKFTTPKYGDTFHSSAQFPCFCKRGATCRSLDGACPDGCRSKSSGPGCQIGDLSHHHRNVQQSSVPDISNGPEMAVDGNATSCSRTAQNLSNIAWWSIALSDAQLYHAYNISVTLEKGSSNNSLYMLISNSSNISTAGQDSSATFVMSSINETTHTLTVNAKAKRFTVFSNDSFYSGLSICDVSITGYLHKNCGDRDYFGPGCLLLKTASKKCSDSNGTVGREFGECSRTRCPNDTHCPPQCWQMMPVLSSNGITVTRSCDVISANISEGMSDKFIPPNTSFRVVLANQGHKTSEPLTLPNVNSKYLGSGWFTFKAPHFNGDYVISTAAEVCKDNRCSNGPRVDAAVPMLQQDVRYNIRSSCLEVGYVVDNQTECFVPNAYEIICIGNNKVDYASVNRSLCHLDPGINYACNLTVFHQTSILKFRLDVTLPAALSSDVTKAAAGAVGSVVTVAAIVVLVFIFRQRWMPRSNEKPASVDQPTDADCEQSAGFIPMAGISDNGNNEDIYENVKQMTLQDFYGYVGTSKDNILLGFRELPVHEFHPCSVGKQTENKARNRYQNIIPYDLNRVILQTTEKNPDGYINASYIRNMDGLLTSIAAQGPTRTTIEEFWEMIWQENCNVIVMLTGFVEQGKRKCEVYFPVLPSEDSGVTVKVSHIDDVFGFTFTTLALSKGDAVKHVNHCHYHLWPDKSVPEYLPHFAMFREKVRLLQKTGDKPIGPIVVHCSAGAGRTGTFIAVQMAIDRYHNDRSMDISKSILKLREQRLFAVQTKEQYLFVHRAVLHDLMTEPFVIKAGDVQLFLERRGSNTSNLKEEWKTLQQLTSCFNVSDYATALTEENVRKNREANSVACDKWRPLLNDYRTGQSLYINAVYCHGYYSKNAFLATQIPLPETVTDFWQMIYETEASAIVLLEDITKEQPRFEYLPSAATEHGAEPFEIGRFTVTCTKAPATFKNYFVNDAELSMTIGVSKAVKHVRIYRLRDWPTSRNPLAEILVDMAEELKKWRDFHQDGPVVVQCRDGATRCGLFIAAINSLHQYAHDDQLFVHHIVEMVRLSQLRFIKDEAQYSLIYDTIQQSRCSSQIYANL